MEWTGIPTSYGSSPLARGLRRPARPPRGLLRIIPARAGFTLGHSPPPGRAQDHPRSRGVYASHTAAALSSEGSSPLARGLLPEDSRGAGDPGIIPARAGFTDALPRRARARRDHPRSRGVYIVGRLGSSAMLGSSPLARGLPAILLAALAASRIIPARAGFTGGDHDGRPGAADHPRSRGVYEDGATVLASVDGSSPLARGLPVAQEPARGRLRIIPARAGFTASRRRRGGGWPDHPRSRGVYDLLDGGGGGVAGSSPLARGLLPSPFREHVAVRIIPARAGFTPGASRAPMLRDGSSPLARGLPDDAGTQWVPCRIIPARAGFTAKYSEM